MAAGNSRTPEEQAEDDVFNESSRIVEDTSPAAIRFCSDRSFFDVLTENIRHETQESPEAGVGRKKVGKTTAIRALQRLLRRKIISVQPPNPALQGKMRSVTQWLKIKMCYCFLRSCKPARRLQ